MSVPLVSLASVMIDEILTWSSQEQVTLVTDGQRIASSYAFALDTPIKV
jgi:hypothetical protein